MAELSQKIVQCPTCKRYYDVLTSPQCPYCNPADRFTPTIDPFADSISAGQGNPTENPFEKTIDPGVPAAPGSPAFDPTIAPEPIVPISPNMGVTQYVDVDTPAGSPSPTVGWLIAISGACRGTDFRIHTGYNDIGRDRGDIIIRGDMTISGEKDANITYIEQTRKFYIAHVQGKNVLTVNSIPVIGGTVELNPYDKICIGSTELLFIPLCGSRFSWKEGLTNE